MAIHMLRGTDEKGVVYFGPRDAPRRDLYWAERGIIRREDTITGEYETLSVRDFLQRMNAISDMLANTIAKDGLVHADEIKRNHDFLEKATELVKIAKHQGLPPRMPRGVARQLVGMLAGQAVVDGNKYRFD